MRVALIADIHGNATALRSVLEDIAFLGVDSVVCLGDLAASGPEPGSAIDMIRELECPVVVGNTDEAMLDVPEWWRDTASVGAPETAQRIVAVSAWCADQLDSGHLEFLAGLPGTLEIDFGDAGRLLCFHGSPRSSTDVITDETPPNEVVEMMDGSPHRFLAGGHTHLPLVRRFGDQTIINPGSVGLPFAEYGFAGEVPVMNHAAYAVVVVTAAEVSVEFREVPVDMDALARAVRSSGMPHGDWWLGLRSPEPPPAQPTVRTAHL